MAQIFGTLSSIVDEKGRIAIPSALRRAFSKKAGAPIIFVRGTEGCVFGYPKDEWLVFWEGLKNLKRTAQNEFYRRRIVDSLKESQLDSQGRALLSPKLRELGSLKKDVVVSGMGDRLEIWDAGQYKNRMKEADAVPFDEAHYRVMDEIHTHQKDE